MTDYPQFKTFSDKQIKINDITADLDDIEADNPEVNFFLVETVDGNEVKLKPRKEVKKKQTRESDDMDMKTQTTETVKYTLDGAPEIYRDINRAIDELGTVTVQANITKITYEDGNTAFQVNTRDADTLKIVDEDAMSYLADEDEDDESESETEDDEETIL